MRQLGEQRRQLGRGQSRVPRDDRPDPDYQYPFTDQWHVSQCDPAVYASLQRNDADAACGGAHADCDQDANYRSVFVSAPDAFPAGAFRAFTQDINLRAFGIQPTQATHLRLRVLASQCTGGPAYAGEQDNDPTNSTDCATFSPARDQVRIAEFQVFSR